VTNGTDDEISAKLPALQEYQWSIPAPTPPADKFNPDAAARGKMVFEGAGKCSTCHNGDMLTDANSKLHDPSEVVSEPEPNGAPSYASRSATKKYRTAPLHGVWQHPPYFHNGMAATLADVVDLYDTRKSLGLTADQKADLVQYLNSL
jgi:cytochrome c peroxidase